MPWTEVITNLAPTDQWVTLPSDRVNDLESVILRVSFPALAVEDEVKITARIELRVTAEGATLEPWTHTTDLIPSATPRVFVTKIPPGYETFFIALRQWPQIGAIVQNWRISLARLTKYSLEFQYSYL